MAQRCARYKRVPSKFGGTVRRCADFRGRSSNGRRSRRSYRKARGALKYRTCKRFKRVRVRGQGMALRCADYVVHRRPKRRGRRSRYARSRGKAPFNKGKKCAAWGSAIRNGKRVRVCRSYGASPAWRQRRARRYAGQSHADRAARATTVTVHPPSGAQRGAPERRNWFSRLLLGPGD